MRNQKFKFQNLWFLTNAPVIIFWRMRVRLKIYLSHWTNSINRFLLHEIWRLKVFKRIWCNAKVQHRYSSMNGSIGRSLVIWLVSYSVLSPIMAMIPGRWSPRCVAEDSDGGGKARWLAGWRRDLPPDEAHAIRCSRIFTKKVSVWSLNEI